MTPLEQRYRSLLRALPAWYRRRWADEMVAAFLDSQHTDDPDDAEYLALNGRPSSRERASVLALAVRLRLGGEAAPPRAFYHGEVARRLALAVLLVQAVSATLAVVAELWLRGVLPWPPLSPRLEGVVTVPSAGAVPLLVDLGGLLWVPAYLALVHGRRRLAALLATAALSPAVVLLVADALDVAADRAPAALLPAAVVSTALPAAGVVLLAAFHRDAPPLPRRPWLRAYGYGLLAAAPLAAVLSTQPLRAHVLLDGPGALGIGVVVAGAVHLARRGLGSEAGTRGVDDAVWDAVLALLAAAVGVLRLASLAGLVAAGGAGVDGLTLVLGAAQLVALVAVGTLLARRARAGPRGAAAATPTVGAG